MKVLFQLLLTGSLQAYVIPDSFNFINLDKNGSSHFWGRSIFILELELLLKNWVLTQIID